MAVNWTKDERNRVQDGVTRYPVESGKCAALARIVFRAGSERDSSTQGRMVLPKPGLAARFIVPKHRSPPRWVSHTLVETHAHAVDALTGAEGCLKPSYLDTHWEYTDCLVLSDVDVEAVDPGIQEET